MRLNGDPLLIRADASIHIGAGHVMRCLALAQAWQETGGEATFAMATDAPAIAGRLKAEGMRVVPLGTDAPGADDAVCTINLARELNPHWVVVDGYQFNSDYQRAIKDAGLSLLFIDDNGHADHYYADLVLNQNIHADPGLYVRREPYTRLLLGTRYLLLRREFLKWREWKREIPGVSRKLLVTMGGGDPDNVTLKVIQALEQVQVDGLEAVVVVGGTNFHYQALVAAARNSRVVLRLERDVADMPALMAWADMAVSGAGSTCWELAFMGLPTAIVTLADNQETAARMLAEKGMAICVGEGKSITPENIGPVLTKFAKDYVTRGAMAQKCSLLADGKGAIKVSKLLANSQEGEII